MIDPNVWSDLEGASAQGAWSRVKRRVPAQTTLDLFLAVAKPSNERMLLMLVEEASVQGFEELPVSKGVAVRIVRPGEDGREASLEIALRDHRAEDIFTALVGDIVETACGASDERAAVEAVVERLSRWQRFLELTGPDGLSSERQRGLYGELWLTREHLLGVVSPTAAIRSWKGPEAASHDYHLGDTAIEVKTTAAKQHQVLRIGSERQLDSTGVKHLFLFHLSLDVHVDSGESLGEIVDDLRGRFQGTGAHSAFEEGLLAAGYFDGHRTLYEGTGYTKREENFFRVEEGFPRIVERDVPTGVGDVRYSVAVSECRHHAVPASEAMGTIGEGTRGN